MTSAATSTSPAYAAESNLPKILGVLTTFFFLAVIVVCLRMHARWFILRALGPDDALIAIATVCQTASWVVILVQANHGLGRHQETLSPAELAAFNHASFFGNVIGIAFATMFLKLGIAANLLRLCSNRWYRVALRIILVVIVIYSLIGIIFFFVNCKPIAGNWDFTIGARCASIQTIKAFGLLNTSCSIATDVALGILPVPIIMGLNMKQKTRLYLVGILSLGYMAVAMDVVKTYYQETYTATTDETYTFSLIFFGFMEICLALIACSVPMLRPMVSKLLRLESTNDGSYYRYGDDRLTPSNKARGTKYGSDAHRGNMSRTGRPNALYDLEEEDAEAGRSGSGKGAHSASIQMQPVCVYQHEAGSQENILYRPQGVNDMAYAKAGTDSVPQAYHQSQDGFNGAKNEPR